MTVWHWLTQVILGVFSLGFYFPNKLTQFGQTLLRKTLKPEAVERGFYRLVAHANT